MSSNFKLPTIYDASPSVKQALKLLAQHVSEQVIKDIVGAMVTGNVESGIMVTYDSVNGKLNFVIVGETAKNWDSLTDIWDSTGLYWDAT